MKVSIEERMIELERSWEERRVEGLEHKLVLEEVSLITSLSLLVQRTKSGLRGIDGTKASGED